MVCCDFQGSYSWCFILCGVCCSLSDWIDVSEKVVLSLDPKQVCAVCLPDTAEHLGRYLTVLR